MSLNLHYSVLIKYVYTTYKWGCYTKRVILEWAHTAIVWDFKKIWQEVQKLTHQMSRASERFNYIFLFE